MRDEMRYLAFFVICFVVFCGWLVVEAGLFGGSCPVVKTGFILQQAVADNHQTADTPVAEQSLQPQTTEPANFGAVGGQAKTVTLGSVDPAGGFKFLLELSSKGASVAKATFSEFDDRDYKDPQPLTILSPVDRPRGREVLSMANAGFVLIQKQLKLGLDRLHWKSFDAVTSYDGSRTARFEATIENENTAESIVKLVKTYTVYPGSYDLDCRLTVENLSASEQKVRFDLTGPVGIGREGIRMDMRKVVGGFMTSGGQIVSSRKAIQSSFLSKNLGLKDASLRYRQAKTREEKEQAETFLRLNYKQGGARFLWSAVTNKYFTAILRPVPDEGKDYCDWVADKTGRYYNPDGDKRGDTGDESIGLNLETASTALTPAGQAGSEKTYNFMLYIGPKDKSLFDKNELYHRLGFFQTIDFIACCCPASIIQPLAFGIMAVMKWMYSFVHNYGVVIIILVFLMRLAMHPVTKKSQVSMSKMSKLTPKVEQIRKKYANNKTEMNRQVMALYKEQGASPVMGMLPIMVQMPVWISLWSAVNASIELRGAAFLPVWITDLSVPDALFRFSAVTLPLLGKLDSFNLLPILMGMAFYLQQKLMPHQQAASTSSQMAQQQKMMMIMMPLMFPLLLYKAPSGVNLYIMASTFAGVIEQYFVRKHIREKEQDESNGLVSVTSKTGGKVKKKKPKPFFKT
jgi:YidC/Oxa1 family membrane protein insertase